MYSLGNYFKVVLIGDSGCGKTSMSNRYNFNNFNTNVASTMGSEFKTITFFTPNNKELSLHIWDTAGQERFRSFVRIYFKDAFAIIFVFDLTNMNSLQNIEMWYREYKNSAPDESKTFIFLVGNKADMIDKAVDNHDLITAYINKYKFIYFETSAKSGANIQELFDKIKEKACEYYDHNDSFDKSMSLHIKLEDGQKKTSCCYLF